MGEYDDAYEFIHTVEIDDKEEKVDLGKVYRKIDWRVLTALSGIYFLQFLDKSLINYAAVMGIKSHLKDPSKFSDLGSILYAGYIIFEPLVVFGFQKLPFAKLFGTSIIVWGAIVVLHAACLNYSSLMAVRFFLGAAEATAVSGVLICNGMWYTHKQQFARFAIATSQVGTATIIGGLLSFAFQHVNPANSALESWQIFFLVMGFITIFFGIWVLIILPDNPMKCKFLTEREKLALLNHLKQNQTGIENKTFKFSQLKSYLLDKHTIVLHVLTIVSMIPTGAINTFSVTIITTLDFTPEKAALMQMPVGISSLIAILGPMYALYYLKGNYRTVAFIVLLLVAIAGYFILIFSHNTIANLFAVYFGNAGTCVITLIYSWNNRNTAGYTKRLIRNCCTMICIAVGCLIGPQLFKTDIPRYLPAKIALLAISAVSIPLVVLLGFISKRENDKRDNLSEDQVNTFDKTFGEDFEYKDLTDTENIHFRYGY